MRIERAAAEHVDGVRRIAAGYGNLGEWGGRPDPLDFELREGGLWVAHDDGAVAGFAGVVRHGAIAHLADLFVARERLGQGIGRRLLAAALPRDGVRITFASGDERVGAYAVVRPAPEGAWLGPAAADAGELLAFAGATAAEHGSAKVALGGPHPALEPLLQRGFRVLGSDTYMTSDPAALDLETYLPEPDLG